MTTKTLFTALGILWLGALVLAIATGWAGPTPFGLGWLSGTTFTAWQVVRSGLVDRK